MQLFINMMAKCMVKAYSTHSEVLYGIKSNKSHTPSVEYK